MQEPDRRTPSPTPIPRSRPTGSSVAYTRRISGHDKIYVFPLDQPGPEDAAHLRRLRRQRARLLRRRRARIYYSSTEDDDIYNLRSLDLKTGVIRQYTDVAGRQHRPRAPPRQGRRPRIGVHQLLQGRVPPAVDRDSREPMKEVEQEVQVAADGPRRLPARRHAPGGGGEQAAKKRLFEKLYLEGRPPLNVGVTSERRLLRRQPGRPLRRAGGQELPVHRDLAARVPQLRGHLHQPRRAACTTGCSALRQHAVLLRLRPTCCRRGFSREGAFATQRYTGALVLAQYPLDKFRRLELPGRRRPRRASASRTRGRKAEVRRRAQRPVPFFLNNGHARARSAVNLVGRDHALPRVRAAVRPHLPPGRAVRARRSGSLLGAHDPRGRRCASTCASAAARVLAARVQGLPLHAARPPTIFYFGGNMELRGYPYLSFAGNEGFFANARAALPHHRRDEDAASGILGPVRGTLYARRRAGPSFRGEPFQFGTQRPGHLLRATTRVFGEPVTASTWWTGGPPRRGPAVLLPGLPAALRLDEAHRPQGRHAQWTVRLLDRLSIFSLGAGGRSSLSWGGTSAPRKRSASLPPSRSRRSASRRCAAPAAFLHARLRLAHAAHPLPSVLCVSVALYASVRSVSVLFSVSPCLRGFLLRPDSGKV